MAITLIKEPYVKVTENIREFPNLLPATGTSNIGGVIVAPTGPKLSYIQGPNEFLKKYTVDGSIPRNADITFINAYYLSFSTGLVIARSMNTTATAGIAFVYNTISQYVNPIEIISNNMWVMNIGDKYYWFESGIDSVETFKVDMLTSISNEVITKIDSDVERALESLDQDSWVRVESIQDLVNKVREEGTYASLLYSSQKSALINQDAPMTIKSIGVNYNNELEASQVGSFEKVSVTYKDGSILTEELTLSVTPDKDNWAFTFGTMAYYHGAIDRSLFADYSLKKVDSIDDLLVSFNGISGLSAEDCSEAESDTWKITLRYSKGNDIMIGAQSIGVTLDEELGESQTFSDNTAFYLQALTPQDSNKYMVSFSPMEGDLFEMTLSDGIESQSFTVSLNPDAVDASGSNCFIENLNALNLDFNITTNNQFDFSSAKYSSEQAFAFGDSGLDLSASSKVECKINALYELEDQELYDIEYLAPLGETNLQFIKNYTLVGRNGDWLTPVDIPYDKTNINSINGYMMNIDDSSNIICVGPFDKNTGLTGWMNYIAGSTLYYTKILNNKARNSEYAPCFDLTNGILDYTNPVCMLGKEDREKLLNLKAPVNFLVYNVRNKVYYFNDNRTHQSKLDIVSEEQNRRMINRIKKDCKRYLQRFKGTINNSTTRSAVVTLLNSYFKNELMGQNYAPYEFNIICNDSNNTEDIINANKLAVTVQVRLSPSTKFIDVLVDAFPLGVDFAS